MFLLGLSPLRTMMAALVVALVIAVTAEAAKTIRPLTAEEVNSLKEVGVLVGRDEPADKVDRAWTAVLDKSKDINVDQAVKTVVDEARVEAERNVTAARKKVKAQEVLRGEIKEELSKTRTLIAESRKRKNTHVIINRKTFELVQTDPPKVAVKPGEVLSTQAQATEYLRELNDRWNSQGVELAGAKSELQTAMQKQQKVVGQLSATSKRLTDSARSIMHRLG